LSEIRFSHYLTIGYKIVQVGTALAYPFPRKITGGLMNDDLTRGDQILAFATMALLLCVPLIPLLVFAA
jgi:hypothetical protein